MKLEIVKYTFQLVNGQPKIVISMVKQMDDEGNYIKFAKMKDICPELSKSEVTFRPQDDELPPSRPYTDHEDLDFVPF